jgi:predicted amidophosphoribosyltransferase
VPVGNSEGKKDHAYIFALELAKIYGGDFADVLTRSSRLTQKELSRHERKNVSFDSCFQAWGSRQRVVLVDDILTTGSTASACYAALGKPQNFEVWTLVYRELSCGGELNLL